MAIAWNGMFHPEDQVRAWARWRHSLDTGEPYEIEYRLRRADGVYRWTLGRALAVRDQQGRIIRWFGTCTDIEEQKQAEEQLRISEERLRLALSAAEMVGTWVWDVQANRITADPGYARLFSVTPEAVAAGLPIETLLPAIHPEDLAATEAAINPPWPARRTAPSRRSTAWCWRMAASAGSAARGRCERDRAGQPTRFPGVVVDVTERRQAEEAKELLARELSHRIKNIFTVVGGMVSLSAIEFLDRGAEFRRRAAAAAERTGGGA